MYSSLIASGRQLKLFYKISSTSSVLFHAHIPASCFHTSNAVYGWPRPKRSKKYPAVYQPTTLRARKAKDSIDAWPKTVWGKRLLGEMKEKNLMESDPWVQNQIHLKYGHIPKSKTI